MAPIRLSATAGPDGVLRLTVPVGGAGEFDVIVSPKPAPADSSDAPDGPPLTTPEGRGWPPGYFENTFGSITDESFVAPPRGPARPIPALDEE